MTLWKIKHEKEIFQQAQLQISETLRLHLHITKVRLLHSGHLWGPLGVRADSPFF